VSLFPIFTVKAGRGTIPSNAGKPVKGCLGPTQSSVLIVVVVGNTVSLEVEVTTTELVVEVSVNEDVVVVSTEISSLPPHETRKKKPETTMKK
jgi:hypothetical protein